MKNNKKGFTLAELLIVIAIMAILIAIAIPVFSAQLEKARDSVDASTQRSAMSLAESHYLLVHSDGMKADGKTVLDPVGTINLTFVQDDNENLAIATCSGGCTFNTASMTNPTPVKAKCTETTADYTTGGSHHGANTGLTVTVKNGVVSATWATSAP